MVRKSIVKDIVSASKHASIKADTAAAAAAAALHYAGRSVLFVGIEDMEEPAAAAAAPFLALELKRNGAVAPQLAFTTVAD